MTFPLQSLGLLKALDEKWKRDILVIEDRIARRVSSLPREELESIVKAYETRNLWQRFVDDWVPFSNGIYHEVVYNAAKRTIGLSESSSTSQ